MMNRFLQDIRLGGQQVITPVEGGENDGALFDPEGAVNPVTGGDTPVGVSNEMKTYTPSK